MKKSIFLILISLFVCSSAFAGEQKVSLDSCDVFIKNRDYQNSIGCLENYLKDNPKDTMALRRIAASFSKVKNFDKAFDAINAALDIDPENARLYMVRAKISDQKGNFNDAIVDLTRAINIAPNEAFIYVARGNLYKNVDMFEASASDFNAALKIDPNNTFAKEALDILSKMQSSPDRLSQQQDSEKGVQ